ncbi:MAG TPA: ABC transporter permease [Gemmatimonadaceae bacterium]|nr:ABC transporter permease [Gemmatimonadaceae bacterium]
MIRDVLTVARKEWLEIMDQLLRFKRGGWSILVVVLFLGVISPLQLGAAWLTTPLMFFYWPLLTTSMTSTLIADSIAGERERHTLETLLASRLPDAAIVMGKILAAVLYGFTFASLNLAIGWIVVNVRHYDGALLLMPLARLAAVFSLIGAGSFFIAGIGVFVSLRAATVRQAQQTFGIIILLLMMGPVLVTQLTTPDFQMRLLGAVGRMGVEALAFRIAATIGAIALVLDVAAVQRFKRGKLVLD